VFLAHTILLNLSRCCSKTQIKAQAAFGHYGAPLCFGFAFLLIWPLGILALTLPTIIARAKTSLPAEEPREMAGVRVAHFEGNIHNTLLLF
jgi:hypothetical protein